ncbi:MAG: GNAT family N-acetyltransferase, partial [Spirochaetales bacterium]|nr:GNAT family N-acetyltransferase [Spirochaetales bacterium]
TVTVSLSVSGKQVDSVNVRTGFRTISVEKGELHLNGKRIFLAGFNRHEDSVESGAAFDEGSMRRDLEMMKAAGANTVRLCHYPHHELELDFCDELGLYALAEIPLYFWDDKEEGLAENELRVSAARRQLETMITRDRNHPSVILWSVSNETNEEHEEVCESNRDLIKFARMLDSSRLCVHVSNHWRTHPNFAEDDIICINAYPSIEWDKNGRLPGASLDSSKAAWQENLAKLANDFPGKPILVTEFGYCSIAGTKGNSFGEDEHARVIEAEFPAITSEKRVCGALIWCWADHLWPAGRFLGGMPVSPFGVVSRSRRTLEPYRAAKRIFHDKFGIIAPENKVSQEAVDMVRQDLMDIPHVPLPKGYTLRTMTMDEAGVWIDIERDAEQYLSVTDTLFREEFGDDPAAVSRRCFILRDERGLAAGTISAWYDRDRYDGEWGRIHWVAVRPAYQRRGFGAAMVSHALRTLSIWHERACLGTDIRRIGAIALYLKFGFRPDMRLPNAVENWTKLSESLNHPAVREALSE